jgi:anti-sigma-K factor RskA
VVHDSDLTAALARWHLDLPAVRTLVYRAPTPRERERWHALWLLASGWTAAEVALALERDPHTVGDWRARFCRDGPASVAFEPTGGAPPPSPRPNRRS